MNQSIWRSNSYSEALRAVLSITTLSLSTYNINIYTCRFSTGFNILCMIMNDFLGNELDIQTVTRPYKKKSRSLAHYYTRLVKQSDLALFKHIEAIRWYSLILARKIKADLESLFIESINGWCRLVTDLFCKVLFNIGKNYRGNWKKAMTSLKIVLVFLLVLDLKKSHLF